MKVWKDKQGNALDTKDFLKRWKQGIEDITPLQQARVQYHNTWIIIVGIIAGMVFSAFTIKSLWWLLIILLGALFNTGVVQIGNYQKYKVLERMEESLNSSMSSFESMPSPKKEKDGD